MVALVALRLGLVLIVSLVLSQDLLSQLLLALMDVRVQLVSVFSN